MKNAEMSSSRSPYWDTVKAILICIVVLGHTGTALSPGLLSVIYAFHMPLFVFVSGYFSKKKSVKEYWGGCKKMIIIYLIFNTLYIGLDIGLGETLSFNRLITPSFALWYILSLIFWRTLLQFISTNVIQNCWMILGVMIVFALLAGFIPLSTQLSFQRTFVFFPFFMMGYYVRVSSIISWIRKRNKIMMATGFVAMCVVCYRWMPIFYSNAPYTAGITDLFMRFLQMIIAVVMSVTFLGVVPEKLGRFTELGKWTLLIYLLHPPFVKLAKMGCSQAGIPMVPNIPMALLITIVTVMLIYSIRKYKLFKYIS